jgi:hypothetical protein
MFTVLYSDDYAWDVSHFYGMSVSKLAMLAESSGYVLVGGYLTNVFLMPKEAAPKSLSAEEVYSQGYADHPLRQVELPWNSDVDYLLDLPPAEVVSELNRMFVGARGGYELGL